LTSLASGSKGAGGVAAAADAGRRLYGSVCGEGATPRLWTLDGTPLSCNAAGSVAGLLGAEIAAAVTLGRPVEALGAFDRDGWYGAKLPVKERARLEKLALAKNKRVTPEVAGAFMATLRPRTAEPRF